MFKKISFLFLLALTLGLLTACNTMSEGEFGRADVSFATSGQGGTFYVAGSGIAALTSREIQGLSVTAEVSLGVVENARLMASGETEMGFLYGSTAYNIFRGEGEFEDQNYTGLRAVANIHDGALNVVTLQRDGYTSINDLIGKTISIGPRGSGSASVAEEFLGAIGLLDQITIQYLGFNDSASSLRDGHIDGFIIGGTSPVPALIELEASHALNILEIEQEYVDTFLAAYPYHIEYTIPASAYTSLTEDVRTVGYTVIWAARDDVPNWVIREMLRVMFSEEGREYLVTVQAAFSELSPGISRFNFIDLPLHEGAIEYYTEAGLID
ncbi:TAXI family TRAP transporter solute-binding subunit [Liberiplasma polymorphum]|uniref:TAXI family TRAP transporter solute-binding subunit n=1 Tax=Liberiplasma polymorphum TaxID=3374570 RepID=UPI003773D7CF